MKAKTIKAVLRKKIDEWLASIEDVPTRELAARNAIVTGGAIASMLLKEKVNDFDVYFRTKEATLAVARYYIGKFKARAASGIPVAIYLANEYDKDITEGPAPGERVKVIVKSAGIASEGGTDKAYKYFESAPAEQAGEYVSDIMTDAAEIQETYETEQERAEQIEDAGFRPVFVSTNAITLSSRVQLVLRFYGEPDQIHENYDYVHCTNYWTAWNNELVLRQPALEALLTRELRYTGSKYPIASLIRMRKFIQRGWSINAGQILKMVMQISELDLKDYEVLREQLTGVDMAYFSQLISALAQKDPTKVNATYLVEIIDRMF